jgi:phospholipase C
MPPKSPLIAGLCALLLTSACSGATGVPQNVGSVVPAAVVDRVPAPIPVGKYIKHVVIVVQENRSFDNFFAGYKGADYATSGGTLEGQTRRLQQITFQSHDFPHGWASALKEYDEGKMDGFDWDSDPVYKYYAYSFVDHRDVKPYWDMAHQWVLADHMFPTEFGPSFTGHLDLIAGTASLSSTTSEVDIPSSQPWGCEGHQSGNTTWIINSLRTISHDVTQPPCFNQFNTMATTLDDAHVTWRYYAPTVTNALGGGPLWSIFSAIQNVCGPVTVGSETECEGSQWKRNVISPQTTVLTDIQSGKLASVSWVIPDWHDSDHPSTQSSTGPSWVAAIVNAVGKSKYWNSTAIVVVWDDWGGWYDNVPPPRMDYRGLGLRVPCLIISPYALQNHVSHTVYEFGSILKFVEEAFDLPALGPTSAGYTDTRARSLADSFDFSQKPRPFTPIAAPYPLSHFLNERPSFRVPDDE